MDDLVEEIKKRLDTDLGVEEIRVELISKGFLEADIDSAISKVSGSIEKAKKRATASTGVKFLIKELFDRAGYGLGSQQFINVLFFQTGASLFMIGSINGVKTFLSIIIAWFMKQYSNIRLVTTKLIGRAGIIFGFSFLFMAIARFLHLKWLFALALLLGSIGAVSYGDLYQKLFKESLKKEKRGHLLEKIPYYGLIVTGLCLLLGAFLIETYAPGRFTINLFGKIIIYPVGYLIAFDLAAVLFIISGYILSFVKAKEGKEEEKKKAVLSYLFNQVRSNLNVLKSFAKNKVLLVLIITSSLVGFVQALANSYYGVFLYKYLRNIGFGGFYNIAVVFLLALIASFIGPAISKKNAQLYGKFPMLVFGTLLMAITPLTYYFNPSLVPIAMATIIGVIGGSIAGVAHGLVIADLMHESDRKTYFSSMSLFAAFPYLFAIPIGAYAAEVFGLKKLFLILGLIMAIIVVPLYFIVVLLKKEKI